MSRFRLKIWRVEQTCIFELAWGAGLQLAAQVRYPEGLTALFQAWQHAYLNFYQTALRARVQAGGGITAPTIDWRAQLVQSEAKFLSEFYFWLSSAELLPLRSQIAKAATAVNDRPSLDHRSDKRFEATPIEVCLTCEPMELARFPWEAWEIGTEFGVNRTIRIARTPANLRLAASPRRSRSKLRVLAILGDDTGLNFQADRQAMQALSSVATIEFVGWQASQATQVTQVTSAVPSASQNLKETIASTIADDRGWDILFFAGHSNETDLTGGELTIAPNQSILIQEIAPSLIKARDNGLQFAIFNSCNGLSIANSLIDLGLSQVAIMREPIHNRVAQEFLLRFVQHLTEYCDVHEAMLLACQFLKVDRNLTYPSAYLIPSLFRHPEAQPFQLEPLGLQHWLKPWWPNRRQAWGLAAATALSLLPPVQNLFLEPRIAVQAAYRHLTGQIPAAPPVVLLVQIDEDSIRGLDARKINPIDRTYLAQVITQAQRLKPRVIGVDFLLDRPTAEDPVLAQAVQTATQQGEWLLFAAQLKNGREVGVVGAIAAPDASLQGHINLYPHHMELLNPTQNCYEICPFAYLLTLTAQLAIPPPRSSSLNNPPHPINARDLLLRHAEQTAVPNSRAQQLLQQRLPHLTPIAEVVGQLWLRPILDYSIPPDRVYQRITAQALLDRQFAAMPPALPIILIAPGGYEQAGVSQVGEDNFPMPLALRYWQPQLSNRAFTGAEAHAYMIQQLLSQQPVTPIPTLWLIGLAAILGQGTDLWQRQRQSPARSHRNFDRRRRVMIGVGINLLYGIAGLQLYISAGLLVPWLLPSAVFWLYQRPHRPRSSHTFLARSTTHG
jgi:CHASE2 domain/CHAT domain